MIRKLAIATFLALGLPQAAAAKDFSQSVTARPGGSLTVELSSGAVAVESHEQDTVRVDARSAGLSSRSLDLRLESDGVDVRLKGDLSGLLPMFGDNARGHKET